MCPSQARSSVETSGIGFSVRPNKEPPETALAEAAQALRDDRVVAAATESSFGLLARASSPKALDRLAQIKPRQGLQGTGLILSARGDWEGWVEEVQPVAGRLADVFWPSALSIVLPAAKAVERSPIASPRSAPTRYSQ